MIKKILLTILISLSLVLPVQADVDISTTSGNTSATLGTTITSGTIYFKIYPDTISGATRKDIIEWTGVLTGDSYISISNSVLNIHNASSSFGCANNDGHWTVPISNTTYQLVAVTHIWGTDSSNPNVEINGVAQTVTETSSPNCSTGIPDTTIYVGGDDTDTSDFDGKIGDIYIYTSELTTAQSLQWTSAKMRGFGLQYASTLYCYWPMDTQADGSTITSTTFNNFAGTACPSLTFDSGTGWGEQFMSYY